MIKIEEIWRTKINFPLVVVSKRSSFDFGLFVTNSQLFTTGLAN